MKTLWIILAIITVLASIMWIAIFTAGGASEQAAMAAAAIAIVIIPYVFVRAIEGIRIADEREEKNARKKSEYLLLRGIMTQLTELNSMVDDIRKQDEKKILR